MKKLLLALLLLFPSLADAQQCLLQGKCIMTDNAGGSPSAILPAQVVANLFNPANLSGLSFSNINLTGVPVAPTNPVLYDSSNQVATDAFVQNALNYSMATSPMALVTGTYSFATTSTNFPVISIVQSGGVVSSATVLAGGSGLAVGDLIVAPGGNGDCILRVATLSGSAAATLTVVYGGTGYATQSGITTNGANIIPYTFVLTGALSGNVTIIMPNGTYLANSQQWFFANNTTNSYTVTVCLSGGADSCNSGRTAVIPQGSNNSRVVGIITDGTTNVDIASVVNAADLTGATLASGVTASSLTSLGTITSLSATSGTIGTLGSTIATVPTISGGGSAAAFLTIESTTGAGTSDYITFKTGSQLSAGTIDTTGHWHFGTTSGPSIASGACGATTNGSLATGASDHAGQVQIGSATTTVCTISFGSTWASAPRACLIFPANATAAVIGTEKPYVYSITTGQFVITGSVLASNNYYYFCE